MHSTPLSFLTTQWQNYADMLKKSNEEPTEEIKEDKNGELRIKEVNSPGSITPTTAGPIEPFSYPAADLKNFYAQLELLANTSCPFENVTLRETLSKTNRTLTELTHINTTPFMFKRDYQVNISGVQSTPKGPLVLRFGIYPEAIKGVPAVADNCYAISDNQLHFVEQEIVRQAFNALSNTLSAEEIAYHRFLNAWLKETAEDPPQKEEITTFIRAAEKLYNRYTDDSIVFQEPAERNSRATEKNNKFNKFFTSLTMAVAEKTVNEPLNQYAALLPNPQKKGSLLPNIIQDFNNALLALNEKGEAELALDNFKHAILNLRASCEMF